jgi:hypothetical protein
MGSNSVTGRDGYITTQALIYAISHIQSLSEERQEFSNMCDMCAILRCNVTIEGLVSMAYLVEAHTGVSINIWPNDKSKKARAYSEKFESGVTSLRDQRIEFLKEVA